MPANYPNIGQQSPIGFCPVEDILVPDYSKEMTKGWKTYWITTLCIAAFIFVWASLNGRFEILPPYSDGHGPDPDSREYMAGAADARRYWYLYAALAAAYWLAFSAAIAGCVWVGLRVRRSARFQVTHDRFPTRSA